MLQPSEVDLALVDRNGDKISGERDMQYRYLPVRVDSVEPQTVLTSGGVDVTVFGSGFHDRDLKIGECAVRCHFGGSVQVPAVVLSDNILRLVYSCVFSLCLSIPSIMHVLVSVCFICLNVVHVCVCSCVLVCLTIDNACACSCVLICFIDNACAC